MVYLTRRERFCAAHKMSVQNWPDEKNRQVFGDCANPNWHGHNYQLFVTVKGNINQETGLVVNIRDLKTLIKAKIIDKVDHKNLNIEVDFMKNINPTTENLCVAIWNELSEEIKRMGAILHKIKLIETENNTFEYYGS